MTDSDKKDCRWWYATAVQIGTNERISAKGPTKEAVDLQLFGQAYAADRRSVTYYRMEAPE